MSKQISKTAFIADVESGMTKIKLAEKYGIPTSVVSKWVKDLGLKLKREVTPKYVLVDELPEQSSESTGY
jgi:transposase